MGERSHISNSGFSRHHRSEKVTRAASPFLPTKQLGRHFSISLSKKKKKKKKEKRKKTFSLSLAHFQTSPTLFFQRLSLSLSLWLSLSLSLSLPFYLSHEFLRRFQQTATTQIFRLLTLEKKEKERKKTPAILSFSASRPLNRLSI